MEIRFKFRSAVNFETIDIGQQSSISVRDVKLKVAAKLKLDLHLDIDLIFYAESGSEYTDECSRIDAGSCVIVKRVPAKTPRSRRELDFSAGHAGSKDDHYANIAEPPVLDFGVNDFDDFGVDLCPSPVGKPPNLDAKNDNLIRRCSAKLPAGGEKFDVSSVDQSNPKDFNAKEGSQTVMHVQPISKVQTELERAVAVQKIAVESSNIPPELKCPLCITSIKEAVMIPCCQYNFCEKCIRATLGELSRCPICSSTKCRPEHLLPNLSLRQKIERFMESQPLQNGLENDLDRYAPDGESGIQMREVPYAVTDRPRDLQLNLTTNVSAKLLGDTKCDPIAIEFVGENQPLKKAGTDEEANSASVNGSYSQGMIGGGESNSIAPYRVNKGLRTCYKCGSPDHLIRDCPSAASSHAGNWNGNAPFQGIVPGYAPPYWPGNPPHCRLPYEMYRGPETMLYNANMAAGTQFPLPPYTLSSGPFNLGGAMPTLAGMNAPQVNQINLEGPPLATNAPQVNQVNLTGNLSIAQQRGSHAEAFEKGEVFDRDYNVDRQGDNAGRGLNRTNDSFTSRAEGSHRSHERSEDDDKYPNGKRKEGVSPSSEFGRSPKAPLNKSTPEKATTDSKIRLPVERQENSHRHPVRKEEMRVQRDDNSSQFRHYSNKESTQRRREENERRSDREFNGRSGYGLEPSYSNGDGMRRKDRSSPRHQQSRKNSERNNKGTYHDRARMTKYSDDDYGEDYRSHKRKRYQ